MARFPEHGLAEAPRLRPGKGARQAFYREDPGRPTITLPRRYRTIGVVLHELVHWALKDAHDLPVHGRTFTRLLLDATAEFGGAGAPSDSPPRTPSTRCTSASRRGSAPTAAGTTTGTSGSGSGAARRYVVDFDADRRPRRGVADLTRARDACTSAPRRRPTATLIPRARRSGASARLTRNAASAVALDRAGAGTRRAESGQPRRSTIMAMPWPPPTHIVSRPTVLSASSSPLSSVLMMRAPVMPNGWPSGIAPPFTLSLSYVDAEGPGRRDDLRGERLVDLDEVDVVDRHPGAGAAPASDASIGPRPMISGSSPLTPESTRSARAA